MKLFSTAAVLAVAVAAQPAAAQDVNWSGPYVGAYAGINAGTTPTQDYWCDAACDAPTLKKVNITGGVTAGYNMQIDRNFVVGLEGDLGTGTKSHQTTTGDDSYYTEVNRWESNLRWIATVRARAGLTVGNTMAYATGGVAFAKGRFSEETTYVYDDYGASTKQTLTGYALGGGIEHSFGKLSVKGEFMHVDLGKTDHACFMDLEGSDAGTCWDDYSGSVGVDDYAVFSPTVNTARIGFNYKF